MNNYNGASTLEIYLTHTSHSVPTFMIILTDSDVIDSLVSGLRRDAVVATTGRFSSQNLSALHELIDWVHSNPTEAVQVTKAWLDTQHIENVGPYSFPAMFVPETDGWN
jgi:hypothetical protein